MSVPEFPAVSSLPELERALAREAASLVYLSTPDCAVCRGLRPKVEALVAERFPAIAGHYVDCAAHPDIAAHLRVFSVPVILVFFAGREWIRQGRATGVAELAALIERPYTLVMALE